MNLIKKNQKIAVFGSNGMVGKSLTKKLKNSGYSQLLLPTRNELDLLDILYNT